MQPSVFGDLIYDSRYVTKYRHGRAGSRHAFV